MKRYLYIVYYWPPCGGASVLRNIKFVKYMPLTGWQPVVHAPENANYPILDQTTFKDIPANIKVLKTSAFEPFSVFNILKGKKKEESVQDVFLVRDEEPGFVHKLAVWVRGNFFIPDARMLRIKPSVKHLLQYLKENPVDAIISTGPPHSCHLIALELKKATGLPWIADFQDPWTKIDYFEKFMLTPYARNKHKRLEKEVLQTADRVVAVSKSWCEDFADLGAKNVEAITMGYDEGDFAGMKPIETNKFVISHFGTLGLDRNPQELWKALAELANENTAFKNDLQIALAGVIDYTILDEIGNYHLKSNLLNLGQLTKDKVVEWLLASGILLLLHNKGYGDYNTKGRIPMKLFEYMGARRPVLALGETDSDVANILNESKAGLTIAYENASEIKASVLKYYDAWKNNKSLFSPQNIEQYSFRNLSAKMAALLDEIT
ncbi:MAG: glycosyl transferase family 1 [Sphingobacteriales bacterium]|nr:MAG: glycosyl transferase family 1 [Sphingobacteriales bacterium]